MVVKVLPPPLCGRTKDMYSVCDILFLFSLPFFSLEYLLFSPSLSSSIPFLCCCLSVRPSVRLSVCLSVCLVYFPYYPVVCEYRTSTIDSQPTCFISLGPYRTDSSLDSFIYLPFFPSQFPTCDG